METLHDRLRKSGQDWGHQGTRLFQDTRQAGESFLSFVQVEARSWGEYLLDQSRKLGGEGLQRITRKGTLQEQRGDTVEQTTQSAPSASEEGSWEPEARSEQEMKEGEDTSETDQP